jgi:hypothetical protein
VVDQINDGSFSHGAALLRIDMGSHIFRGVGLLFQQFETSAIPESKFPEPDPIMADEHHSGWLGFWKGILKIS